MTSSSPSRVTPPPIVKTLVLLRIVELEIATLRRGMMILPPRQRATFRVVLEALERRARQLATAARRMSISH